MLGFVKCYAVCDEVLSSLLGALIYVADFYFNTYGLKIIMVSYLFDICGK